MDELDAELASTFSELNPLAVRVGHYLSNRYWDLFESWIPVATHEEISVIFSVINREYQDIHHYHGSYHDGLIKILILAREHYELSIDEIPL